MTRTHSCWTKHISNKNAIDRKFCKHSRKINCKDYTNRFFLAWLPVCFDYVLQFDFFFLSQIWQKPSENHSFNSKNGAWNGLPYHKDSNHSNEMHCPFHSDHLNFDLKRTKPKSFQFDLILASASALVSVLIVFRFGFLFKLLFSSHRHSLDFLFILNEMIINRWTLILNHR